MHSTPELSIGWIDPRVGLGWVGLGREWVENLFLVGWLGHGSEMTDVRKNTCRVYM